MKKLIILATTVLFNLVLIAQNKTEFTLTLKDGNVVTGSTKMTKVSMGD